MLTGAYWEELICQFARPEMSVSDVMPLKA